MCAGCDARVPIKFTSIAQRDRAPLGVENNLLLLSLEYSAFFVVKVEREATEEFANNEIYAIFLQW